MIDFENANNVFDVYSQYPRDGRLESHLLGRFYIENGQLRVLEDHDGLLNRLKKGPVSHSLNALKRLEDSPYLRVVEESEVTPGQQIETHSNNPNGPKPQPPPPVVAAPSVDSLPQQDMVQGSSQPMTFEQEPQMAMQTPPAVFDYFRPGMREPQQVEVHGSDVFMNGQKLGPDEAQRLLYTVQSGLAKLKYRKGM